MAMTIAAPDARARQCRRFTVTVTLPPHEPTRPVLQPPRNPFARNPSFDVPVGTWMLVLSCAVCSPASMRPLVASTLPPRTTWSASAEQCCGDVVYRTDVTVPFQGGVTVSCLAGAQTWPVEVQFTTN